MTTYSLGGTVSLFLKHHVTQRILRNKAHTSVSAVANIGDDKNGGRMKVH
jgi:hypothetical protein